MGSPPGRRNPLHQEVNNRKSAARRIMHIRDDCVGDAKRADFAATIHSESEQPRLLTLQDLRLLGRISNLDFEADLNNLRRWHTKISGW